MTQVNILTIVRVDDNEVEDIQVEAFDHFLKAEKSLQQHVENAMISADISPEDVVLNYDLTSLESLINSPEVEVGALDFEAGMNAIYKHLSYDDLAELFTAIRKDSVAEISSTEIK